MPMMCGGTGSIKEADETVQALCDGLKSHIEKEAGKNFDVFVAKSYTSQVVCGTNYFVKIHVGGDEHIHVCIHKKLQCNGGEASLTKMVGAKSEHEPIGFF